MGGIQTAQEAHLSPGHPGPGEINQTCWKGLGSCPLQECIMLGKPRGKLGSHSVHAHTTCLLGNGSCHKTALRMASKLNSFPLQGNQGQSVGSRRLRPQGLH